jgi:hypothetical protein
MNLTITVDSEICSTARRSDRCASSTRFGTTSHDSPTAHAYGSVRATSSAGSPRALIAIAMYCLPPTM